MKLNFLDSSEEITKDDWDAVLKNKYPFLKYDFLKALETTKCVSAEQGWSPLHIVVSENTPVKAVAEGRVVLASWTSDSGYVIIIDHGNQILSVYKHNAALTKKQGDFVKVQEVIASSGSSGQLSTGPHLHFELWNDGNPIDPTTFIDF